MTDHFTSDVKKLSAGIKGIYTSKQKKTRIALVLLCCTLALSIVAGCLYVSLFTFTGEIVVIGHSESAFKILFFRNFCPHLLAELDMSVEEFQDNFNVSFFPISQGEVLLSELYGEHVELDLAINEFAVVVLNRRHQPVLLAYSEAELLEFLKKYA